MDYRPANYIVSSGSEFLEQFSTSIDAHGVLRLDQVETCSQVRGMLLNIVDVKRPPTLLLIPLPRRLHVSRSP